MATSSTTVNVRRTSSGYLVDIAGRGTRRESCAVYEFAMQALTESSCEMVVDLSACQYVDSTFLGCLVGLQKMYQRQEASTFSVASPSAACRKLLAAHHLDVFLKVRKDRPDRMSNPVTIPESVMDADDVGTHIMECHRMLADICEANRQVFGPIADQLAKEIDAKQPPRTDQR